MKIILRDKVANLGEPGDIVTVKDGYARNYLIPKKLAYPATPSYLKIAEEERRRREARLQRERTKAQKLANKLSNLSLEAMVQVGEDDKVHGSVTAQNIADLLKEKGYEIDKRDILLPEPLKALGIYNVPVRIWQDIKAEVKVWVIKA